jgi:hypothetical protein
VKLDYSDQAARQAAAIDEWWVDNRPKNPALFGIELLAAEDAILLAPYGRPVHRVVGKIEVRRFPMPRTRHHLYYYVDEERQVVRIISVWGAIKEQEPDLDL